MVPPKDMKMPMLLSTGDVKLMKGGERMRASDAT
jgi:hypothetical protein